MPAGTVFRPGMDGSEDANVYEKPRFGESFINSLNPLKNNRKNLPIQKQGVKVRFFV